LASISEMVMKLLGFKLGQFDCMLLLHSSEVYLIYATFLELFLLPPRITGCHCRHTDRYFYFFIFVISGRYFV
jgi:hypothetical protein